MSSVTKYYFHNSVFKFDIDFEKPVPTHIKAVVAPDIDIPIDEGSVLKVERGILGQQIGPSVDMHNGYHLILVDDDARYGSELNIACVLVTNGLLEYSNVKDIEDSKLNNLLDRVSPV